MIQTRKLHGVSVFVWSFRDNMGFCVIVYREKLKNDGGRKRAVRELFFFFCISDPLPLFLKMTVLFIFFPLFGKVFPRSISRNLMNIHTFLNSSWDISNCTWKTTYWILRKLRLRIEKGCRFDWVAFWILFDLSIIYFLIQILLCIQRQTTFHSYKSLLYRLLLHTDNQIHFQN